MVSIWDAASGEKLDEIQVGDEAVHDLAYIPDDNNLLVLTSGENVYVYDFEHDQLLHTLHAPDRRPLVLDTAPQGLIAVGYNDGAVRLWDARSGERLAVVYGAGADFLDLTPNGEWVAFGIDGYTFASVVVFHLPDIRGEHIWLTHVLDVGPLNGLQFFGDRLLDARGYGYTALSYGGLFTISYTRPLTAWQPVPLGGPEPVHLAIPMHSPKNLTFNSDASLLAVENKVGRACLLIEPTSHCPTVVLICFATPDCAYEPHVERYLFLPALGTVEMAFSPNDHFLTWVETEGYLVIMGIPVA